MTDVSVDPSLAARYYIHTLAAAARFPIETCNVSEVTIQARVHVIARSLEVLVVTMRHLIVHHARKAFCCIRQL